MKTMTNRKYDCGYYYFVSKSHLREELRKTGDRFMMDFGWGNGYVVLPKDHPCYGMSYDDIHGKWNVMCNGGLTFASLGSHVEKWEIVPKKFRNDDYWIVGYDTAHSGDTLKKWPKRAVEKHTRELSEQFKRIQ